MRKRTADRGLRTAGTGWRPPTRRAFVQMLAAAAAAIALKTAPQPKPKQVWIGHF